MAVRPAPPSIANPLERRPCRSIPPSRISPPTRRAGAATFIAIPNSLYDVPRTAAFVAERLEAFGCDEVATGIGRTGVVGIIRGRGAASARTIGLRADMDALPIHETTNLAYQSANPGKMHACGHDGHTAMLLGAARYLAQSRNFSGTAVVIFQPAEEGGGGGKAMLDDGLMERFGIQQVYGMHNWPKLPVGAFAIRKGPFLAAADRFTIDIEGRGGHAAQPHLGVDPIVGGRADRQRAADDRRAQCRSARFLRRLGHLLSRRRHRQCHPANGPASRHDAHAGEQDARLRRKENYRDRQRRRRRARRERRGRSTSAAIRRRSIIPNRRISPRRSREKSAATIRSRRTRRPRWAPRTFPICWRRGPALSF